MGSPSMREGRTWAPTQTGRVSTRAAGRWSERKCWRLSSRRNWTSGTRGPSPDFRSGSANGLARRLVLQIPQKVRRMRQRVLWPRKTMRRRKRNASIVPYHSNVCSDNEKQKSCPSRKKKTSPKKKKKKKKKK